MRWIVTTLCIVASLFNFAQIVDDSTKQVYGTTTTHYYYFEDILNNDTSRPHGLDTSLYHLEQQSFFDIQNGKYQNLGNVGTATFDSYFNPTRMIGRTSGFTAFVPYAINANKIRYFDTKSPFIDLSTFFGGQNRNIIRFGFSRNVNKNWNLGFDIKTITSDKQIARRFKGDRHSVGNSYDIYTHYQHPKRHFQWLASYTKTSHKSIEYGGVRYSQDSLLIDLFRYTNALTGLEDAENVVKYTHGRFYQEYNLVRPFKLYHRFKYYKEENTYNDYADANLSSDNYDTYRDFYSNFFLNDDTTSEKSMFQTLTNEIGLKGTVSGFFYRVYAKIRNINFGYSIKVPQKTWEGYLGGMARFIWKDKFSVVCTGELSDAAYHFKSTINTGWFSAEYISSQSLVPYIFDTYQGNHYQWENSFNPTYINHLRGNINISSKKFEIQPFASVATYGNFLYFDNENQPQQANSVQLVTRLGSIINLDFLNPKGEGFHFDNELLLSTAAGGDASKIKVPPSPT